MANVRLNDRGRRYAETLISDGAVDTTSRWTWTAADGNAILGDSEDWAAYAKHHLGVRPQVARDTKAAYAYPFAKIKSGKSTLYRSALVAIRVRSAQQGHRQVFAAAGELLAQIDSAMEAGRQQAVWSALEAIGAGVLICSLDAVSWDHLPEAIVQLLPLGQVVSTDGRRVWTRPQDLDQLVQRFAALDNPLPIDYEHATFSPFADQAPAAGWIWELWSVTTDDDQSIRAAADRGDIPADVADAAIKSERHGGLYARVRFTKRAAQAIKDREYLYLSPAINHVLVDDQGHEIPDDTAEDASQYWRRPTELLNAAVTNLPALDGMLPLAARRQTQGTDGVKKANSGTMRHDRSDVNDKQTHGQEVTDMDWKDVMGTALGREVATPEDAASALAELRERAETVTALEERVETLTIELATAQVDQAIERGVVAPGLREWALEMATKSPDLWSRYLEAAPTAPPAATDSAGDGSGGGKDDGPPQWRLNPDGNEPPGSVFRLIGGLKPEPKSAALYERALKLAEDRDITLDAALAAVTQEV